MNLFVQLDGELLLAPGFASPPNMDYQGYHSYIDETLPPETPYLYGLHPNAEIGFLTGTSENLFRTVLEMQPRDSSGAGGSGITREEKVCSYVAVYTVYTRLLVSYSSVTTIHTTIRFTFIAFTVRDQICGNHLLFPKCYSEMHTCTCV